MKRTFKPFRLSGMSVTIAALVAAPGFACQSATVDVFGVHAVPLLTSADCPPGYNVIAIGPTQVTANGTSGSDCLIGNALDNILRGRGGADFIAGGLGDDEILGGNGNDEIFGEEGADYLRGQSGADLLHGGPGADDIRGGTGADDIRGNDGDDDIQGNAGADVLSGGAGNDVIRGQRGADTVTGDDGDDWIDGGQNPDDLDGGPGDDVICGGGGTDIISGGGGNDTLKPDGGNEGFLTSNALLNDAPRIDELAIFPGKFINTCETAQLLLTASDLNGDPITVKWSIVSAPVGTNATLPATGNPVQFGTDTAGAYALTVVAVDAHGAAAQLTFPMHVSPCP